MRCLSLAEHLVAKGHNVTLITTSRSSRLRLNHVNHRGVHVVEFPALFPGRIRSGWDPLDIARRLLSAVSREPWQFDVVHAFDSRPSVILPALVLSNRERAPLILDWADWWGRGGTIEFRDTSRLVRFVVRWPETWFEEAYRTRAAHNTVISSALAERAHRLGVPRESITVLPQGCDISAIRPVEIDAARGKHGLPSGVPIVGYAGSLLNDNALILLKAFQSIKAIDERIQLLLIGNPGRQFPDVRGVIRSGFVPREQLSDLLGACDILLLPLTNTTANTGRWPSKINDYMAAGRPTVASPVGDIKVLFSQHEIGLLGNVDDGTFQAACRKLLNDPEMRATMGRKARSVAETDLSWDRIGDSVLDVYSKVVSAHSLMRT